MAIKVLDQDGLKKASMGSKINILAFRRGF